MQIDLVWIAPQGEPAPHWSLGSVVECRGSVTAVAACVEELPESSDCVLFWHANLGTPETDRVLAALATPGDVWHAGLRLGMGGRPQIIDYVDPVWRFNRDPAADIVAMSWRLSLQACLVSRRVLDQAGGPDVAFRTLAGASLELGHRWVWSGALMRHIPELVADGVAGDIAPEMPLEDQFLFVRRRFGRMWSRWAGWREWRNGRSLSEVTAAIGWADEQPEGPAARPLRLVDESESTMEFDGGPVGPVSVLIPTLDRYPQLFNLLDQLREQTVPPLEIVVVDQTAAELRRPDWPDDFPDLPLVVIWREEPGQCSSRNAGLAAAQGDFVLFLDDDDEIEPDLIARHLAFLDRFQVDASCGVAEEVGAEALPAEFRRVRDSDVFPTNNSVLRREALNGSGLFDLAYERGERADADLGMRLYLAGSLLALNPHSSVLHLHAPRGGLRQHDARAITRNSSRNSLRQRQLAAPTEAYLWQRYFTPEQAYEAALIRSVGTLRGRRSGVQGLARTVLMSLRLPFTIRENRERLELGKEISTSHPTIPRLQPQAIKEIL